MTSPESVDRTLEDAGKRWAAERPHPAPLDVVFDRVIQERSPRRTRSLAFAAAIAVAAVAAVSLVTSQSTGHSTPAADQPTPPAGAASLDTIHAKALQVAAEWGDSNPNIQAAFTTYVAASAVEPNNVPSLGLAVGHVPGEQVWVVSLSGSFACACGRSGTATGVLSTPSLTIIYDASATLTLSYWAGTVDLSKLGPVFTIATGR